MAKRQRWASRRSDKGKEKSGGRSGAGSAAPAKRGGATAANGAPAGSFSLQNMKKEMIPLLCH